MSDDIATLQPNVPREWFDEITTAYNNLRDRARRLEESNERLHREAAQNNAAMGIMARERDDAQRALSKGIENCPHCGKGLS